MPSGSWATRRGGRAGALAVCTGLALGGMLAGAAAQDLARGQTVLDRPRPGYTPQGATVGGVLLRPSLDASLEVDDNILAHPTDRRSDLIVRVRPELEAVLRRRDQHFAVAAGAERGRYLRSESENYLDARAMARARVPLAGGMHASLTGRWQRRHDPRRSVDEAGGAKPTVFRTTGLVAVLKRTFETREAELRATRRHDDYDDVRAQGEGTINNDDRDHAVYRLTGTGRQRLAPRLAGFARTTLDLRDYRGERDDFGLDRDSRGHETVAGLEADLTGVTVVRGYLGVRQQSYADPGLPTLLTPAAGLRVTASPTQLTSLQFGVARALKETALAGIAGRLATTVDLTVDHELRRNLLLRVSGLYERSVYIGPSTHDHRYRVGLEARYLTAPWLHWRLRLERAGRSRGSPDGGYRRHALRLGLSLQY